MWAEGDHRFQIRYSGYGPYGPGVSKPVTITVARKAVNIRVGLSASTVRAGTTSKVTVTLPKDATGHVARYDDTLGGLGSAAIDNGTNRIHQLHQATGGQHTPTVGLLRRKRHLRRAQQ